MKQLIEQARRVAGLKPDTDITFMLHPGSRGEEGFVTFFLYEGATTPVCLAKVARADNALIEKEAANLRAARTALSHSPLMSTIDNVLDVVQVGDKLILFKEFRPGQPVSRVFARKNRAEVLRAFRAVCDWIHRFITDTSKQHIHDRAAKFAATRPLVDPALDNSWVDTFLADEHHFLGPSHGDLVPANILMDVQGRVSTVVDFENYDAAGMPMADFVGLIVSTGTKLFGRGAEMMQSTFGKPGWFSEEVARQVKRYCTENLCELDDFTRLLPLYSDRAISIATRWGMVDEREFHLTYREYFLANRAGITDLVCTQARPAT